MLERVRAKLSRWVSANPRDEDHPLNAAERTQQEHEPDPFSRNRGLSDYELPREPDPKKGDPF